MGKSAGPQPDFTGAAEQTAQSGREAIQAQTLGNRPNTSGPFSFQNWSQGADGSWGLNSGLSGGLGSAAGALSNQAGQALGQGLDPSLFGKIQSGDAARDQATKSAYDAQASRLDPRFAREDTQLRSRLANQGLDPNSQAARGATSQFGRDKNDAYSSAMANAIGIGNQAGNDVFRNNAMQHQMSLSDALTQRNAPLSWMSQLQGMAQQGPQFNSAGAWNPTDYSGATRAAGDWQMQDAQQQNQFWGDLAGGLTGLGGSFTKLSDERLKQDIRRLETEALPGVPFASWEWKHNPGFREVGVIAQDLAKVAPQYVLVSPEGFLMVDYSFLKKKVP